MQCMVNEILLPIHRYIDTEPSSRSPLAIPGHLIILQDVFSTLGLLTPHHTIAHHVTKVTTGGMCTVHQVWCLHDPNLFHLDSWVDCRFKD